MKDTKKELPHHTHHTITLEDSFLGIPMSIFLVMLLIIGFTIGYFAAYQLIEPDIQVYKEKIALCSAKNPQFVQNLGSSGMVFPLLMDEFENK